MPRMNLLHYGLQRSGTNVLETLLNKNYKVRFLNSTKDRQSPLVKHCRFYDEKHIIPEPQYLNDISISSFDQFDSLFDVAPEYYLIISKDPYSWYISYKNWASKCNWPDVKHHYAKEYNFFYDTFLKMSSQTDKIVFVKYIDIVKDSIAFLSELESRIHLRKKVIGRIFPRRPNKVAQSSRFTDERRLYYLEQQYLDEYTSEELTLLNSELDPEVVSSLGYSLHHPAR